jgi:hypothetical protein
VAPQPRLLQPYAPIIGWIGLITCAALIQRFSRTHVRRLFRHPATGTYHDTSRHEDLEPPCSSSGGAPA